MQSALANNEWKLRAVLDGLADGVMGTDATGHIDYVNPAAKQMLAHQEEELLGRNIDELFSIVDGTAGSVLQIGRHGFLTNARVLARRRDGATFPVVLSVGESVVGERRRYTLLFRDPIGQRAADQEFKRINQVLEERVQERTALLKLLQKVAFSANLAERMEEVVSYALMRICRHFNWAFGCAYIKDESARRLTPLDAFYCAHPAEFEGLQRDIHRQALAINTGLAGKVAARGQPVWSYDLENLDDPVLGRAAGIAGVDTALGFPLLIENRVVAVLVFLLERRFELDSRSADAMQAMGAQLGSFIERKQAEAGLRSSEERFHAIFQNAAIGIALVEVGYSGRFLRTNRAFNRMLGYEAYQLNQFGLVDVLHPDDLDRSFRLYHELLEGLRSTFQIEAKMYSRERQIVWCRLLVSLMGSDNNMPASTVVLVEDISDRKRAEEELRRISISLDHAHEGIAHIDHEGRYLAANRAYAEILGTRQEELIGNFWESSLSEEDVVQARAARDLMRVNGKADFWAKRQRNGAVRYYRTVLYPAAHEPTQGYYCLVEDLTDRKRLEKEITDAVLDGQRRIGQELQEGLTQQLTGMRMMARDLRQRLERRGLPESGLAADFLKLVTEAQYQAKAVIKGLRPVEVDANGLMAALHELAASTENRFGITCLFQAEQDVPVEDNDTATQLFYIAKEAVTELVKRAPGTSIVIRLGRREDKLTMSISENGPTNPGRVPDSSDMSVRIMHYRASIMGANLEIYSADGGGISVVCTL